MSPVDELEKHLRELASQLGLEVDEDAIAEARAYMEEEVENPDYKESKEG